MGDVLYCVDCWVVEWFGEGGDVVFVGEVGQVGFWEYYQFGVCCIVGDGCQGVFQVVCGVVIVIGDLDEFDFYWNFLLFLVLFGMCVVCMQGLVQYVWCFLC